MGSGWLEACRSQGKLGTGQLVFLGNPGPPYGLLDPRMCRGLQALAALQTSHSSGWSLVCSRSAGCLVSSLSGVGRVTFISCLLAPVGASLAAL